MMFNYKIELNETNIKQMFRYSNMGSKSFFNTFSTKRLLNLVFIFIISIVLVSCGSEKSKDDVPAEIIQPEEMVNVLVDFHLAEATLIDSQTRGKDFNAYAYYYYDGILKSHNISRKKFLNSYIYYCKRADLFKEIYEEVIEKLSTIQPSNQPAPTLNK